MDIMKKLGLFLCLIFILSCASHSVWIKGAPKHHIVGGYRNYPSVPTEPSKGFLFNLRRVWDSFVLPEIPSEHSLSEKEAIVHLTNLKNENTITWLGHSTFLLRIQGKTILTDPFLTELASPLVKGPRRFVPPGISIKNLPPIDIIIVSHNHYDHLDKKTIATLPDKKIISVLVPLGLKDFFLDHEYKNVYELDWEGSANIGSIQIVALPAVHNSKRGVMDKNRTLWCSWALLASTGNYFFVGDTGYSPIIFRRIGKKFKSFNLAILPIGAYEPRKIMWMSHVNPEEAIEIGLDINAKVLVPSHWGTIKLSDEPLWEPPERFREAARLAEIAKENIWIMKIGDTRSLP